MDFIVLDSSSSPYHINKISQTSIIEFQKSRKRIKKNYYIQQIFKVTNKTREKHKKRHNLKFINTTLYGT